MNMNPYRTTVNSYVSLIFIASFALYMATLIWHAADMDSPIANALVPLVEAEAL